MYSGKHSIVAGGGGRVISDDRARGIVIDGGSSFATTTYVQHDSLYAALTVVGMSCIACKQQGDVLVPSGSKLAEANLFLVGDVGQCMGSSANCPMYPALMAHQGLACALGQHSGPVPVVEDDCNACTTTTCYGSGACCSLAAAMHHMIRDSTSSDSLDVSTRSM